MDTTSMLDTSPIAKAVDDRIDPDHLQHAVAHAAHLLPAQGPITVFVHHNTLHAFEDLPFEEAVKKGSTVYGCEPYLPEDRYRAECIRGRILTKDLSAVLMDDLGNDTDKSLGLLGTRYQLRMAMLQHPLRIGPAAELRWLIAETDALMRFRRESPVLVREQMIENTRRWVKRDLRDGAVGVERRIVETTASLFEQFNKATLDSWSDGTWESFTLHLLWRICHQGVHGLPRFSEPETVTARHRDLMLQATGQDSDRLVHEVLIRLCSAFLDQGFANWAMPHRDEGFFRAFAALYRKSHPVSRWMRRLPAELRRIEEAEFTPLESIGESLDLLGVPLANQQDFITQSLLALGGWAGMMWQMESNAEWTVRPAPAGSLVEFLAVRLILERLALEYLCEEFMGERWELSDMRSRLRKRLGQPPRVSVDQRAYLVFQLAQIRGWNPADLHKFSKDEWSRLVQEIESFPSLERRRIYHRAYERRYLTQALDALQAHQKRMPEARPHERSFQLVTCIDDREESFRRHLEEVDSNCETFAVAGFYSVAMNYKSAADAHFRPLCPVIIKPQHFVTEEAAYSLTASSRQRAETRRLLGTASHRWHVGSRTFIAGILTALLGSVASIPIVARILFPRLTSQLRRVLGSMFQPPAVTELRLLRTAEPPGPEEEHLGYTIIEMADIVERVLRDIGLTRTFARIVLFVGHGSGSLNNPHESAYNCGACSGGRGGPNARAFAQMANDALVRRILNERGIDIPETTAFVGAFHNTCDEDVSYYDLDRLPVSCRRQFEAMRNVIDDARARNAHERSRRFESADINLSMSEAIEHVQTRAEDLSQARPEYNHATNALCIVGRRERTRGLFLDRRAFLSCYDPTQDDEQHTILAGILRAAVPVCAGISLEYYFSCVDVAGYGCGSKLPHNIVSLLGVMEGAASDLRTGLSQQMIEIHEPVRILFIIETTPEAMLSIMDRNPVIDRLVRNDWVRLAVLDPNSPEMLLFAHGKFEPYSPEFSDLPVVESSLDWYRGQRDHLGFASISADHSRTPTNELETA